MKRVKLLILLFLIITVLLIIPNVSNAAVEYTRTITGNDGSIIINLTGLELDEEKAYAFAITTKAGTPENWHDILEYTSSTAKIHLNASTSDIRNVLKVTDTANIYIKDKSDDSYVLEKFSVNVKLPYLQALTYEKIEGSNSYYNLACYSLYASIGNDYFYTGADHTYSKWEKVTDVTFVEKFLDIKNNDKSIEALEEYLPEHPISGYTNDRGPKYGSYNDGLYILWVKLTGNDCKEVFGCIIHDGLPEATTVSQYLADEDLDLEGPIVEKIDVTSPISGSYKAGETVKIRVYFSEPIKASTVPTLKIKFGESEERLLANGTVVNETEWYLENYYIEYSYEIQDGDKGQLATVSLAGGNVKDVSDNIATLTCPVITGNTIQANIETTTPDDNQGETNNDKDNNNQDNNEQDNNDNVNKEEDNKNENTKEDNTVAPGEIPQTGVSMTIVISIITIAVVSLILYKKYSNYKDIK